MSTINVSINTSIAGLAFGGTEQIEASGQTGFSESIPAGKTVTAWVKSDANTAACDLPAGHGYTDGNFDVYDSAGTIIRYGVAGTISTNALSLDGGTGADFPASATTGIIVCKQVSVALPFVGSSVQVAMIQAAYPGHVDFQTSAPASLFAGAVSSTPERLAAADFDGTNAVVLCSNGSALYANEIKVGVAHDVTP